MRNLRRNAAIVAVTTVLAGLGIGGAVAHASSGHSDRGPAQTEQSDGDGETNDDATDQGPDANPNEPGHQDASDAGDAEGDGETNDDVTDQGPDANPNEPGHQDASDPGDGDGETNDGGSDQD